MTAILEAIYVTDQGGGAMAAVDDAQAVAFQGLAGDRYGLGRGYWSRTDGCQVTLIAGEDLDAIAAATGVAIHAGQHRRNLVVRGIDPDRMAGKLLRIGVTAIFQYERPRPPCGYIATLGEPGMTRALAVSWRHLPWCFARRHHPGRRGPDHS